MNPRVRAVLGVSFMSLLLALYFVFAGVKSIALFASGDAVAVIMGIALLVFPLIGAWALVREIMFGFSSTKLVDQLAADGDLPEELVGDALTRGEVRGAADAAFSKYRDAAEAAPESWRAFMRLGLIYDAAGDRKRARSAIRQAISLNRN